MIEQDMMENLQNLATSEAEVAVTPELKAPKRSNKKRSLTEGDLSSETKEQEADAPKIEIVSRDAKPEVSQAIEEKETTKEAVVTDHTSKIVKLSPPEEAIQDQNLRQVDAVQMAPIAPEGPAPAKKEPEEPAYVPISEVFVETKEQSNTC